MGRRHGHIPPIFNMRVPTIITRGHLFPMGTLFPEAIAASFATRCVLFISLLSSVRGGAEVLARAIDATFRVDARWKHDRALWVLEHTGRLPSDAPPTAVAIANA